MGTPSGVNKGTTDDRFAGITRRPDCRQGLSVFLQLSCKRASCCPSANRAAARTAPYRNDQASVCILSVFTETAQSGRRICHQRRARAPPRHDGSDALPLLKHHDFVTSDQMVYLIVDNRKSESVPHWPAFASWWASRRRLVGPQEERTDILWVCADDETGLRDIPNYGQESLS